MSDLSRWGLTDDQVTGASPALEPLPPIVPPADAGRWGLAPEQVTPTDPVEALNHYIANSPDPTAERARIDTAQQSAAALGLSPGSMYENLGDVQIKKLGTAIADRWKAEKLTVRIGQIGNDARKAFQKGDEAEYDRLRKEYDTLSAQLPGLEDVEPAYPDNILGKALSFGRRAITGGAGLVSQQLELVAGAQQQEKLSDIAGAPATSLLEPFQTPITLKGLAAPYAAMLEQGKQAIAGIGEIESGSAFMDLVKAGVDPSIADRFAKGIGAINNAIEFAQVVTFVKMFPGAGAVIEKGSSALVRKLLLGPVLKNKALNLTMQLAKGTAEQLGQEIAQEAVTFYGENWATEIQNATKGTDFEGNTDFMGRVRALVKDFLPGVLALGAIPIGMQAFKKDVKATAKPVAKVEPAPMEAVRADVAQAMETQTPEAAKATLDIAETAKAGEIERAELLTPALVNEAVELSEMQDAVEGKVIQRDLFHGTPTPFRGVPRINRAELGIEGLLGGGVTKDIFEGFYTARESDYALMYAQNKPENVLPVALSPDAKVLDLSDSIISQEVLGQTGSIARSGLSSLPAPKKVFPFQKDFEEFAIEDINQSRQEKGKEALTEEQVKRILAEFDPTSEAWNLEGMSGKILEKYVKKQGYDAIQFGRETIILSPDKAMVGDLETIIESGKWVDDTTLGQYSIEPWAQNEIENREDLRSEASYLADTGQVGNFDTFLSAIKGMELSPKSDDYYQNIWDTTAKADVELDEEQEVTTEARIDATIAAEEKQTKKGPVTDRLLGELEKTPMWSPKDEVVSDVLTAKRVESKAVEGEEFDAAQMANDVQAKKKRLVQRMTHDFLKKPSAGIGQDAIDQIRTLQEPYTAKETKSLNKAKKALQTWQAGHPGQALIPEAQAILNRKSIKDISVGDLIDLWKQSRDIRQKGAVERKAKREATHARRVQMATDMQSEIPGGVVVKRLLEFASEATQKQERKLAKKGLIKSNVLHPLRIFKDMGKTFERVFWDERKKWEGREIVRQKQWDRAIKDLFEKTGTTATEMLRKLKGTDYYIDDLMTYYGQMQDPNGRRAVLFGNDEEESKITRIIGEMPQKFKDFVDGVIDLNGKAWPDIERVQIEQNGVSSPKVERHLHIKRQGDFGKAFSEELSTDAAIRDSARVSGLQKGFINQRKTFKEGTQQSRIRTDFLNILVEQITKESRYVAGEEWARDMGWLLGGRAKESKRFLEAVKQKHGQKTVDFLKDYVNAVVKPESFNGQDFNGLVSRVFRNFSDAALMYKLSTAFIQVEGPFRTLSQLDLKQWPYLAAGLWKASIHPGQTAEFVYEKSPVMQAMAEGQAIDPALKEGRGLKHSRTEIGLGLQMAHRGMRTGGYAMLTAMNKWTVLAEWTSKYYADLARTGDEAMAIKGADDAVFLNQPSGALADAPRMYWSSKHNIIFAFLTRFTRATNQMAQMMTVDLWNDLKTGHPGKALGVIMAFAIGAYLNGLRKRKRLPETPEEYLEDGIAGVSDTLGSMTFGAVPALVSSVTGGFKVGEIKPLEPFSQAGAIAKDVYYGEVSEKEVWRLISTVMQATGLPAPAAENIVRSAYDFETDEFRFDPIELFGRRPRE